MESSCQFALPTLTPAEPAPAAHRLSGLLQPGCSIAIIGAGARGLAAIRYAINSASANIILVDLDQDRLDMALRLGATTVINGKPGGVGRRILQLTGMRGLDVVIDTLNMSATARLSAEIVAALGTVVSIGPRAQAVDAALNRQWMRCMLGQTIPVQHAGLASPQRAPLQR